MRVREASVEDCEAMGRGMKLVADEGRWLATERGADATTLAERFRAAVAAEDHFLFVLDEHGELAGSLGMHPTPSPGVLSIGMWILPRWRGRGGGRMLVEAALAARPDHVHKIELEAFPDNEAAIGLYGAMGFEREGLRRRHLRRQDGSLRDCLMMARLFD
jgi:L-phenylalanine/L-methionine N-acetyltransferase